MAKKKTLYIVTLEPIEQRYTKQWYHYWKKEFSKYFNVVYIDGTIGSDKIEKGRFLDINKTNIWKAEQVEDIAILFQTNMIEEGDIFLFMDAWHFGLTALKYMSQLNNIPVKIYGYWHAGTYDKHDFITEAGLGEWATLNEAGWLLACDGHFVATKFHKDMIMKHFEVMSLEHKIHVVGFPMDFEKEINKVKNKITKKEDLIVFPHRIDKEKQPEVFDMLAVNFLKWKWIKTIEVTKDKKEYYRLIQKAKIIFSANLQETFGIGTVEALLLGAAPLVPDRLSYVELYSKIFRYRGKADMQNKLQFIMYNFDKPVIQKAIKKNQEYLKKLCLGSIEQIAKVMLK